MASASHLRGLLAAASSVIIWVGCGGAADGTRGDDENVTAGSDCDISVVATGKRMTAAELAALRDPVAKLVLSGKSCPTDFKGILEKLGETDKAGGCEKADGSNITTGFLSETAQVLDKPTAYRGIHKRSCGGRSDHELLASFSIAAGDSLLPPNVELIGEDTTAGVFNFYARENNQWKFFGSSKDFVTAGYDCEGGACESKAAAKQRCAGCHTGGGLVMKELQTPWVHSESESVTTPGTDDVLKRFPALGEKHDGANLETLVQDGNKDWIPKRIAALKPKGVAEVLRPLFCTLDVNLQSGRSDSGEENVVGLELHTDLFVDPVWEAFDGFPFDAAVYQPLVQKNGQFVVDAAGKPLVGKKGPVTDTFVPFTYPSRVSTGIDADYNAALVASKLVDEEFAKDVLHIDFTRPIFSDARCSLLSAAPSLDAAEMSAASIRAGFIKNLEGRTGAAAQLLADLKKSKQDKSHDADVKKFLAACKARPIADLLADAMTYASHLRNRFRKLRIAEFPESLVTDKIPDSTRAFDPDTCTLK